MTSVRRYDLGELSKVERLDNGFMRIPASLTRAGIFKYRLPDGTIRRELRHPDEVFNKDSMDTLRQAPVTNRHPPEMVTAENAKKYSVGSVGENILRTDAGHLAAVLMITDADAVNAIDMDIRRQISCGYTADMIMDSGIYNGEPYDARQTNIRYNHSALVEVGRAGSDIRVKLDSEDAVLVCDTIRVDVNPDPLPEDPGMEKQLEELGKELQALKSEHEATCAKLDAANERLEAVEVNKNDRKDADEFRKAVLQRVELERQASPVLGDDVKLDAMNDLDIRKAVVAKLCPKADLAHKTDAYLEARYDAALESYVADEKGLEKLEEEVKNKDDRPKNPYQKLDSAFIPSGGKQ